MILVGMNSACVIIECTVPAQTQRIFLFLFKGVYNFMAQTGIKKVELSYQRLIAPVQTPVVAAG